MRWCVCTFFCIYIVMLCSCAVRNAEVGIATILHPGGKGMPSMIEYRVGKQRYVSFGPRQRHLAKGEHFQLRYDRKKPWKHVLLTEAPAFLENEHTQYTEGKVVRCVNADYTKVSFTYEVNGKSYKKLQVIRGPTDLAKKENCLVKYCTENPARAILISRKRTDTASSPFLASSAPSDK